MLEQGPDFWCWFDTTHFSYHCVHPIHAKMFSIQMSISQIVLRVCTLVLFIIMASLLSGVIRSLLCKPRAFSPAITISRAFIRRAPVQSIKTSMTQDINAVARWISGNHLQFNFSKCKYMTLSRKRASDLPPPINLNSLPLGQSHRV